MRRCPKARQRIAATSGHRRADSRNGKNISRECVHARLRGCADNEVECANGSTQKFCFRDYLKCSCANEPKSARAHQRTRRSIPHQMRKLMVRSTLYEICSALLRRFFRFRPTGKSCKKLQFWKVFKEKNNDASHSLKPSLLHKTKLHQIFKLHETRFPEGFIKPIKKYDFKFSAWR